MALIPLRSGETGGELLQTSDGEQIVVFGLDIDCPPVVTGRVGVAYSQSFSAADGTPAYTFALIVGSLPAGLVLGGSGLLSGTPLSPGTYAITVRAIDSNGDIGDADCTLTIAAATSPIGSGVYSLVPGKTHDTLYNGDLSGTTDVKIP